MADCPQQRPVTWKNQEKSDNVQYCTRPIQKAAHYQATTSDKYSSSHGWLLFCAARSSVFVLRLFFVVLSSLRRSLRSAHKEGSFALGGFLNKKSREQALLPPSPQHTMHMPSLFYHAEEGSASYCCCACRCLSNFEIYPPLGPNLLARFRAASTPGALFFFQLFILGPKRNQSMSRL